MASMFDTGIFIGSMSSALLATLDQATFMISSMPKWVGDLFSHALRPNMQVLSVEYLSPQVKKVRFNGAFPKCILRSVTPMLSA